MSRATRVSDVNRTDQGGLTLIGLLDGGMDPEDVRGIAKRLLSWVEEPA